MKKNYLKCAVVSTAMSLVFAMGAQAAVKSVTITKPTKKSTMNVYRTNKLVKKTIKVKVKTTGKTSKKVTYKTSNKAKATVTKKGVVTFKKAGKVKIYVTSKANKKKKDTITFNVIQRVSKISAKAKNSTITVGGATTITKTVTPKNAKNKAVSFTSSDKKIATVTSKGVVKGIAPGTVKITVKAKDGSKKKAVVKITVKAATPSAPTVTVPNTKTFTVDAKAAQNLTTYFAGVKVNDTAKAATALNDLVVKNNNLVTLLGKSEISKGSYKLTFDEKGLKAYQNGKEVAVADVLNKVNEKYNSEFAKAIQETTANKLAALLASGDVAQAAINGSFNIGDVTVKANKNAADVVVKDVTISAAGVAYTEGTAAYNVKALKDGKIVVTAPTGVDVNNSAVVKFLASFNKTVVK